MNFRLTDEQKMVVSSAKEIAEKFNLEYWREKDRKHEFPVEFWDALAKAGFVGMILPEEYGGGGMGLLDLTLATETLGSEACGIGGGFFILLTTIFVGLPVAKHGTKEQKEKYLPKICSGEMLGCMAVTEPEAGSNTLNITTTAKKEGDEYVINGQKVFISNVDKAHVMLLLTRTTPIDKTPKRSFGLSLFLIDLPNPAIEITPIEKLGLHYVNSCEVFINDLRVSEECLLGEKDKGFYILWDVLNPERINNAANAVSCGLLALKLAVKYAKQRSVFKEPIGAYQGIQLPLAEAKAKLEAARLLYHKAAWLFDEGLPCGAESNMAKVVAVEAAGETITYAYETFGGYGYAVEQDIERIWRDFQVLRVAPITQQLALAYIGERVLGLPKSYQT